MSDVETMVNEYGPVHTILHDTVWFTCLGGYTSGYLTIEYVPGQAILEFMSFRKWLRKTFPRDFSHVAITEGVCRMVLDELRKVLQPKELGVKIDLSCDDSGDEMHGSASVELKYYEGGPPQ